MSINLNDNLIVQAPKATDERYGPYASEAEALATIEPIVRYQGLTVGIIIGGSTKEYWFKGGIADSDFVIKTFGPPLAEESYIALACSDEETPLTTGSKVTFHMPYSLTVDKVKLGVNTPPVGDDLVVDLILEGTSIFSTKPVISDGSEVGGYDAVLSTSNLPLDFEVSVNVDQVGSTSAGTGLKVWLLGVKGGGE